MDPREDVPQAPKAYGGASMASGGAAESFLVMNDPAPVSPSARMSEASMELNEFFTEDSSNVDSPESSGMGTRSGSELTMDLSDFIGKET